MNGPLRRFAHVRVSRQSAKRYGQTGTVVNFRDRRVWVCFPGGEVVRFNYQSVEVLAPRATRCA